MKNLFKVALVGLALGAAAGVASATVGSEDTTARPCCSSCDAGYDACIAGCTDDACYNACDTQWTSCFRWCSFSC
jgi:hypothetical protein